MEESDLKSILESKRSALFEAENASETEAILSPEISEFGKIAILTELFRNYSSGTLKAFLTGCPFLWKDIKYDDYLKLLRNISNETNPLYDFTMFSSGFLAIDIRQIILTETDVDRKAVSYMKNNFQKGTPRPLEVTAKNLSRLCGVDFKALWKRLASEGAPSLPLAKPIVMGGKNNQK